MAVSYQGQSLPLGDSDVESEEEYAVVGGEEEEEETEEQKKMKELVTAIKNGWGAGEGGKLIWPLI